MLEILGFIALIAIIFGVSMTAAVGIIIKAILWIIGGCFAIAIVSKMKARTAIVLALVAIVVGGCLLAGMDSFQNKIYAPCFSLNTDVFGWEAYSDCMLSASETVEARYSTSIWLIIGVLLLIVAWVKGNDNDPSNKVDNVNRKNRRQGESKEESRRRVKEVPTETMNLMIVKKSQQVKERIGVLAKKLPSLKRKVLIGSWATAISFIIGPVMLLVVLYFLPGEINGFMITGSVISRAIIIVASINVMIFPFFLMLTPYWIINYKSAKKELEKLKSLQKKIKKYIIERRLSELKAV